MFLDEMPDGFRYPQPEDDQDKQLLARIQRKGWHNLSVPGEEGEPAYSFTLGHFLHQDHPELIVVGLKEKLASRLLDSAALGITGLNRRLRPYQRYADIADGLELMFLPVTFNHYNDWLGYANWFYAALPAPYPALQMVWPDPNGVFPWQPGYDQRFRRVQPLLGTPPVAPTLQ